MKLLVLTGLLAFSQVSFATDLTERVEMLEKKVGVLEKKLSTQSSWTCQVQCCVFNPSNGEFKIDGYMLAVGADVYTTFRDTCNYSKNIYPCEGQTIVNSCLKN